MNKLPFLAMKKKSNAKQVPFASTDQMQVLAKFKPNEVFVWHTLTRVCAEVLKIGYPEAERFAAGLLESGTVLPASKIGLTDLQTFKIKTE